MTTHENAKIEVGHNNLSEHNILGGTKHNWGLPMLVVSLTTTEEALLLDHKYQSYTESNSRIQVIIQSIIFPYTHIFKKRLRSVKTYIVG